jgi:acyl-coenzyme A synthetase/AMP-(fatty) acid ligase
VVEGVEKSSLTISIIADKSVNVKIFFLSPRRIIFIDEMQRSASGKILKYRLREQFKA